MTPYGKHVRTSSQVTVGKHGIAMQSQHSALNIVLVVLLAIGIALVPITIAWNHGKLDSQAFADSARSAFPDLNDATSQAEASGIPNVPADYTNAVGTLMQNSIMSGGCEIVSLGIVLESMGIPANLDDIVNTHLDINGHFATGYSGSPYSQGAGYPRGIAAAANGYLESQGLGVRAHDLTGTSFQDMKAIVEQGYPVLVWTTMGCTEPHFTGAHDEGMEWYDNEHCVVLYGFEGSQALVSDPLEGLVKRDASRFADIYERCGSMALAIY